MIRILLFLFPFLLFAAPDPIGNVIALEGTVRALVLTAERLLQEGSPIFLNDTIITESDARAQIQFSDGGLLNLIPNTEYKINTYSYRKFLKKDRYTADLIKGGFRSLSGSIAKKNPEDTQIKTPSATIGLRGTMIEVRISDGTTYFGVTSGKAVVFNEAGSTLIGVGQPAQFITALGPSDRLVPNFERPPELNLQNFSPPTGGVSLDQAQTQQATKASTTPKPAPGTPSGRAAPAPTTGAPAAPTETAPTQIPTETTPTSSPLESQSILPQTGGGGVYIHGGC